MATLVPLVLIGCGGHASDVLSVIEACNGTVPRYRVLGYLDDDPVADGHRLTARGVGRLGAIDAAASIDAGYALGIGYPEPRARVLARLRSLGELAGPLLHPDARLATGVVVEPAVVVFDGVRIGPLARLALGSMVGRGSVVGHDTVIGELASIMPGAVVSGDCSIGAGALVGSNSTVLEGRSVGPGARLGAGAVLLDDLPPGCTAAGVPARVVRRPQAV